MTRRPMATAFSTVASISLRSIKQTTIITQPKHYEKKFLQERGELAKQFNFWDFNFQDKQGPPERYVSSNQVRFCRARPLEETYPALTPHEGNVIIIFINFRSVKDTWVNYLVDEEFAGPDDYIEKMMKPGEWADNIAIQLTADLLRRRIIIITTGMASFSIHCETFFTFSKFPRRNFFLRRPIQDYGSLK